MIQLTPGSRRGYVESTSEVRESQFEWLRPFLELSPVLVPEDLVHPIAERLGQFLAKAQTPTSFSSVMGDPAIARFLNLFGPTGVDGHLEITRATMSSLPPSLVDGAAPGDFYKLRIVARPRQQPTVRREELSAAREALAATRETLRIEREARERALVAEKTAKREAERQAQLQRSAATLRAKRLTAARRVDGHSPGPTRSAPILHADVVIARVKRPDNQDMVAARKQALESLLRSNRGRLVIGMLDRALEDSEVLAIESHLSIPLRDLHDPQAWTFGSKILQSEDRPLILRVVRSGSGIAFELAWDGGSPSFKLVRSNWLNLRENLLPNLPGAKSMIMASKDVFAEARAKATVTDPR
jgi:hypothetical protein